MRRLYQIIRRWVYNKRHGVVVMSPEAACRFQDWYSGGPSGNEEPANYGTLENKGI